MLRDTISGIKEALNADAGNVPDYFKSEKIAFNSLNPYILSMYVEFILEIMPEVILEGPRQDLMTVSLLSILVYRDEGKL
jgi:hypothetical protein